MHIHTAYILLAALLGHLHPFTVAMRMLLDEWVGAVMELPGLLAPITNGLAACIFWMALQFHQFFQAAQTQPGQGLPAVPCMTKLIEQLHLHMFAHLAPSLPARYLPTGQWNPPGAGAGGQKTPTDRTRGQNSTRMLNPQPNATFHAFDKAGQLGTSITKHPAPTNAKGQPICLSWHMQNACNHDCPQAADHQAHTAAKDNAILAWAKIALVPNA